MNNALKINAKDKFRSCGDELQEEETERVTEVIV